MMTNFSNDFFFSGESEDWVIYIQNTIRMPSNYGKLIPFMPAKMWSSLILMESAQGHGLPVFVAVSCYFGFLLMHKVSEGFCQSL